MRDVLGPPVDRGEVPGLVALVDRDGRQELHALGVRTLGQAGAVELAAVRPILTLLDEPERGGDADG